MKNMQFCKPKPMLIYVAYNHHPLFSCRRVSKQSCRAASALHSHMQELEEEV